MLQNGDEAVLRHATGEGDGVSFGDTYIESPVRHLLHQDIHRASRRHGRCHPDDFRVHPGQFE